MALAITRKKWLSPNAIRSASSSSDKWLEGQAAYLQNASLSRREIIPVRIPSSPRSARNHLRRWWGGSIRASQKLAAILAISMAASPAFPTENGSQMYPVGTNTVFPGIAPSPGQTWWQNYNLYYSADTFGDNKGNSLVPGFQLDVAAYAPRFFHGWRAQIGPFGLASAFVVPIIYSSVGTDFSNDTDFNIGEVTLQPLYLSYSNKEKTLFAYGGVDFNLPTFTAVSRRYVTANPIVTFTWFPAKSLDINMISLVELALSENASTDYRSGNLVVLEYSAHARPFAFLPKLSLGVNGYYVDQFTSDEAGGVDIGFEGKAFAVGPELVYQIGESAGFAIKWQHEFDVKNRPEGEKFWFQFQKPLGTR